VATSERVFTSIDTPTGVQRATAPGYLVSSRPVWPQIAMDLLMISAGLMLVPAIFGEHLAWSLARWSTVSPVASAMLMVTIFVFTGAYPRHRTPLDIGDTEGLMRGISCLGVLLVILSVDTRTKPGASGLITATVIAVLLAMQREYAHILRAHKSLASAPIRPAFPVRSAMVSDAVQTGPECELYGGLVYRPSHLHSVLKRTMDIAGAAILLLVASPLLLAVAILIKIDSPGPAFIRQRRIGRYCTPFYMWKFRSMHAHVERYARSPISDADPRLTTFGRALRRFSVDELPQLLNVLQGEMSLVGPRPEMPFIVNGYLPHERLRLNAIPGITGLWQISPARAMPIHENVHLDLFYIESQNIFLDLAILLRTVTAVFRGIGAT
jgi:lipopolysaccharide/colanic/teichoic acid biosynthesis glycosyltransferase